MSVCHTVSVESVGALSADMLVLQALQILMDKCTHFLEQLDVMEWQQIQPVWLLNARVPSTLICSSVHLQLLLPEELMYAILESCEMFAKLLFMQFPPCKVWDLRYFTAINHNFYCKINSCVVKLFVTSILGKPATIACTWSREHGAVLFWIRVDGYS